MTKKIVDVTLKALLSVILLLPILGLTGVFPEPTRDLYNSDRAFAFIRMLTDTGYINYLMAVVHIAALVALWTGREALAALLIAPITANIVGFHLVLDGGLLKAGSVPADIMLALNIYFLWKGRNAYKGLWVAA